MTKPRGSLRFARQSRVRVRSALGLAALCFAAAAAAFAFGWIARWLLWVGGFFCVVAVVELLNARWNERHAGGRASG